MVSDPHRDGCLGAYEKYKIVRTDGRDAPGEKHHDCQYFVLDLTHDPYAIPALEAYAAACRDTHGFLAAHLEMALTYMREGKPPFGKQLSTRNNAVKAAKAMMPEEYYGEDDS